MPWNWGRPRILELERPSVPPPDDAGTTHISVMDVDGNAIAITQTVNTIFGSGITARGTGIVLNNEMNDFAAAGCLFIISAVESLSDRVLTILDKRHTREDVVRAFKFVRDAGIALRPT